MSPGPLQEVDRHIPPLAHSGPEATQWETTVAPKIPHEVLPQIAVTISRAVTSYSCRLSI
eukprot:848941-Pyramimonas_sp.AAC.1